MTKPPSVIRILGFVDNQRKWATVAREVNFGGSVASVIWSKQPAIESTTRIDIPVRNYVVHAWHFQCEIMFLGPHIEWVYKYVAVGRGRFLTGPGRTKCATYFKN